MKALYRVSTLLSFIHARQTQSPVDRISLRWHQTALHIRRQPRLDRGCKSSE
jgi:hypothetical protein